MEHTKHIWRAILIVIIVTIGAVVVRHFLMPKSFGMQGFYRYDSLAEFMDKPVIHGSLTACQECHSEIFETKIQGGHASVSCEVCHAPLTVHVKEDTKIAAMPTNSSHVLCAYCHQELRARPESLPQVDITEHLAALELAPSGDEIPEGVCIVCHDVHDPSLD